ncbi:MAG: lamin tail domain-containing protein, partial [Planctomycetota bacterium]
MTSPTLGSANADFAVEQVMLSEIMFHPASPPPSHVDAIDEDELEFVEVFNNSGSVIDIGNWRFRQTEGASFTVPAGVTLAGGDAVLMVGFDPLVEPNKAAAFRDVYGLAGDAVLLGPYGGRLRNEGETLDLLRPEAPASPTTSGLVLVDRVSYDDAAPWPSGLDGTGDSLHRKSVASYGNFADSWRGAIATPGSVEFNTTPSSDFNGDGDVDADDLAIWETGLGISSGASPAQGDSNRDGAVDGHDFLTWQRQFGAATVGLTRASVTADTASETASRDDVFSAAMAMQLGGGHGGFAGPMLDTRSASTPDQTDQAVIDEALRLVTTPFKYLERAASPIPSRQSPAIDTDSTTSEAQRPDSVPSLEESLLLDWKS